MPKPIKPRAPTVLISDHAWKRWMERADRYPKQRTALAALFKTMLYNHLRSVGGVETYGLAVSLDMGRGIKAVLRLGENAWICTTVIDTTEPREVS